MKQNCKCQSHCSGYYGYPTCPSLHLDLLGKLEYEDESWFNKDGNIRVCLCLLTDATETGHCQDSEENIGSQVCVPRGTSLELRGCLARCAIRPSAKVNSTRVFFSSPTPPGHLRELKSLELSLTSTVSICYSEGKVPAK